MPARLIDSLGTTGPLADLFSDDSLLQAMLDFEVALARAEARLGIVPQSAADAVQNAAKAANFDAAALTRETLRAGTPAIPLVKALTAQVRKADSAAARFVHWGATSQDVVDTALILLLKRSQPILAADLGRLEVALRRLSDEHNNSTMLGRTLLQAAPPVTFGLKAAGWLGAIRRSTARLETAFAEALVLQFGGASGTLAALEDKGIDVGRAMAEELHLGFPDAPWHAHRDRLGALIAACGVLTGSLGKMARDISLLMQGEVAEAAEPAGEGRGGSSTMPQKHNPIASSVALASANRVPGLVAAFLSGMVQEHERGVGGLQAEWPTVAAVIQATGVAAASMAEAAEGLDVNSARMRENIDATRGSVSAERAMMALGTALGRDVAHKILGEASRKSASEGRHLSEVLAEMPEVTKVLDGKALRDLETPEGYLGVADALRKRLISPEKEGLGPMPFVAIEKTRSYYRLEGVEGQPVLVLSHAIGCDHGMWAQQMPDLLDHLQVLRYDTRGHGASDIPRAEYSMELLGRDVLALVDSLKISKFAFCGLSLGGMVGQWLAINAGNRLTRLVLANTSPQVSPKSLWDDRRRMVLEGGMAAIVETAMGRFFSPETLAQGNPYAHSVRTSFLATDPAGYAGCCSAIRDMDHTASLAKINVPTLVIAGDHDVSTPWAGHGEILAREIPGAKTVHFPSTHLSNIERPRSFTTALLNFLQPNSAASGEDPLEAGFAVRREVLGEAHVDRAIAATTDFNRDFQALITRYAWGTIWARPGFDRRTRRLLVLAMMASLGRWDEFRMHVRAALEHGFEPCDLKELLMQSAIYAGVPVANSGFHIAIEEIEKLEKM